MLNSLKEVKLKPTKYLLSLIIAILLAAVMVVPALAQTGDTTITANLEESITIYAPTGKTEATLSASTADQTLIAATGNVTSNVNYDVTAVDKMEVSKSTDYAGRMLEWDGAAWGTGVLNEVVKVWSNHAQGVVATALDSTAPIDPITIISNATAGADVDSQEIVTIETVGGDTALAEANHWYKITITFTASKYQP